MQTYLNLVHWHQSAFAVSSSDRATMLASPGFDAAGLGNSGRTSRPAPAYCAPARNNSRLAPKPSRLDARPGHHRQLRSNSLGTAADVSRMAHGNAIAFFFSPAPTCFSNIPPAGLPFTLVNNYGTHRMHRSVSSGTVTPHDRSAALPHVGTPDFQYPDSPS